MQQNQEFYTASGKKKNLLSGLWPPKYQASQHGVPVIYGDDTALRWTPLYGTCFNYCLLLSFTILSYVCLQKSPYPLPNLDRA